MCRDVNAGACARLDTIGLLEAMRLIVDLLKYVLLMQVIAVILRMNNPQIFMVRCSYFPNFLRVLAGCEVVPF
jgi:hypothetical protein